MALKILKRKQNQTMGPRRIALRRATAGSAEHFEPAETLSLEADELKQYLQLERYGVVAANPERWRKHPHIRLALKIANEAIDRKFAIVPEGCASLPQTINDAPGCPETEVETRPFLLARQAVTNAQFQKFVDAGGYDDLSLWPEDIWPHLIDFKDLTDHCAPRFWKEGRHNKIRSDHPVVGICYYEAAAYVRWAGYRLPTEAEWQVAASWRIRSSAYILRRYPWGDALDTQRCNIWASGVAATIPAGEYESGAAPNGVLQLVGNVWEWMASDFEVSDDRTRPVVGDMPMKSVRGGAFDTYFPAQATSCFRTGLASLVRAHNVGLRCALDMQGN